VEEGARDAAVVAAVARSAAALVVLDAQGRVERWGAGAEAMWGWAAPAVVGRPWADVGVFVDTVRRAQAAELLERVLAGEPATREWFSRCADGSSRRLESVYEPVRAPDGEVVGLVVLSFDLSRLEQFEQALVREALHDQLTGLPGRALVTQAIGTAQESGAGAAVLFVDLDDFKLVNDHHGHRAGDEVLAEVARRLRSAVRSSDVVGRIGGDEFVAVAPLDGRVEVGEELADRIRAALAPAIVVSGGAQVVVTASVGVAEALPGEGTEAVLRRADAEMYRRKSDQPE
jgi:diguanylate cyclase (GGDEF)-like protein/PAS domain S-box-containing protein